MDENDFKRLLDESAAETQHHIDARAAELQHHVDATFNEMGRHIEADFAGIRRHYVETAEGLRRHFDVAMEKPRHEIRLLQERVVSLNQRVDRMSFEMRAGFAETWALLKSFQRPEVSSE
ncbi:MAG TPA: hypothetical protein VN380_04030 [Thermoanaerobaculia bacterium]|nr:hypothetical protein [Thermoanaerobaculia bacterium]